MTKYVPKRLHFSHHGMIAKTQLAVLPLNSIVNAEQALTKDNVPWYKLQFSKITQTYVVKQLKQVLEKKYLDDLMWTIIDSF